MNMHFPASECTSGIYPLTYDRTAYADAMVIENTNIELLKKVVAAERLYGLSSGFVDTVLAVKEAIKRSQVNVRTRPSCWFAKFSE